MAYEDTTHGSAQQDAFQALGGNAGPQGVRPQQAETAAPAKR